ncbi:DUF218 domain-containing protein [Kineococcus xinjiangensis]|uniref:DUF218 domain-containing protein n=1 Tax=Kineococcus xinjiangensis TaxID=512762 RepID=A0A2S6IK64_9ACTN|nr:YdcF family protein [Kineococcus xinjiangensis]PPK94623.1 DUF218 domain-containing protein [Kineococcus xinjiangensis]
MHGARRVRGRAGRGVTTCALALLLAVAVAEIPNRRASRRGLPGAPPAAGRGPEVVLVLGHPCRRDGRLHPMQRWRTDIAVRSMHPQHGRLVFSGAGREGGPSEAEVMADYARRALAVPAERIALETRARSTWENVAHSLPLLEDAAILRIASAPLHAARARRYLAQQRPDLAQRLAAADDYRFGECCGWKLATVAYGVLRALRRSLLPRAVGPRAGVDRSAR